MNTRKMIAVCLTLVLALGLPLTVLAEEYDLANGSIEVTAKDDGQYVSQTNGVANEKQTTPTVIRQTGGSTENTVTIKAEENQTAEVTLSGVNIDTSNSGDAAVTTGGEGNVTIELDGSNTVKSGYVHAGVEKKNEGNLTIADEKKNGSLNATGGKHGAGIGGGKLGDGSNITVSGGEVTAKGGENGAGIGGGFQGAGSGITVKNGKVTATGGENGAGIGGGYQGAGSGITIENGEVKATGGEYGAGIGGGYQDDGSGITVKNGTVNATGGNNGAGIGGGHQGAGSSITVENGEVTATGGDNGAGIGGGYQRDGSSITIENGEVTAKGGEGGAGIGGGCQGAGSGITVKNGKVNAAGGKYSAGIGGGNLRDGTNITVNNGEVKATGGDGGAGIGGGAEGSGSEIAVSGDARVTVQGGKAGIGAGTGAGIGSGGNGKQNGEELSMDPDRLKEGTIRYYAPGANMQTNAPTQTIYNTKAEHNWDGGKVTTPATCTKPGVRTYTCQTHSAHTKTQEIPALGHQFETYVYNNDATYEADGTETALCAHPGCNETDTRRAPGTRLYAPVLYRVTDGSGKDISCQAEQTESVLTITVKDAAFAILTGSLRGIGILRQQGVETIRFVTKDAVSTFRLDKLLQQGGNSDTYTLTHDGKTVTFTCKDRDIQKILEG